MRSVFGAHATPLAFDSVITYYDTQCEVARIVGDLIECPMPFLDRLRLALADRCAIEDEIDRGGMAVVYLPVNRRPRRKVAVNVRFSELAQCSERFLREIETAAKLNHPHVVPLNDSGEANSSPHDLVPQMEDGPLRERLGRARQLPADDALRIAGVLNGEISSARRGMIHTGSKPVDVQLPGDSWWAPTSDSRWGSTERVARKRRVSV